MRPDVEVLLRVLPSTSDGESARSAPSKRAILDQALFASGSSHPRNIVSPCIYVDCVAWSGD